jgi:flagellar biosynthesis/type III secretory pathway M-ring protein FliF/YscJ
MVITGTLPLADSSFSGAPAGPLLLIILGFIVVAAIVVVSAVVLTRAQRAERERRLDGQMEERRLKREQEAALPGQTKAGETTPSSRTTHADASSAEDHA